MKPNESTKISSNRVFCQIMGYGIATSNAKKSDIASGYTIIYIRPRSDDRGLMVAGVVTGDGGVATGDGG